MLPEATRRKDPPGSSPANRSGPLERLPVGPWSVGYGLMGRHRHPPRRGQGSGGADTNPDCGDFLTRIRVGRFPGALIPTHNFLKILELSYGGTLRLSPAARRVAFRRRDRPSVARVGNSRNQIILIVNYR